jgi:anti-anti-sigma factor
LTVTSSEPPWGSEKLGLADELLLTVSVEKRERAVVLSVAGDVDLYTVPRLAEALERELRERPEILVVDLDGVEFLGSVGLTALLTADEQAAGHTLLRVVAARRVALGPLQLTGLDKKLAVRATVEEALRR